MPRALIVRGATLSPAALSFAKWLSDNGLTISITGFSLIGRYLTVITHDVEGVVDSESRERLRHVDNMILASTALVSGAVKISDYKTIKNQRSDLEKWLGEVKRLSDRVGDEIIILNDKIGELRSKPFTPSIEETLDNIRYDSGLVSSPLFSVVEEENWSFKMNYGDRETCYRSGTVPSCFGMDIAGMVKFYKYFPLLVGGAIVGLDVAESEGKVKPIEGFSGVLVSEFLNLVGKLFFTHHLGKYVSETQDMLLSLNQGLEAVLKQEAYADSVLLGNENSMLRSDLKEADERYSVVNREYEQLKEEHRKLKEENEILKSSKKGEEKEDIESLLEISSGTFPISGSGKSIKSQDFSVIDYKAHIPDASPNYLAITGPNTLSDQSSDIALIPHHNSANITEHATAAMFIYLAGHTMCKFAYMLQEFGAQMPVINKMTEHFCKNILSPEGRDVLSPEEFVENYFGPGSEVEV